MDERDLEFLREAMELARSARRNGNHPFGAVLVDENGNALIRAVNTVVSERDFTGHAEMNLMRSAGSRYDAAFLAHCTVYASTEPCPMCAGALFWGNVRRVVFGLSEEGLYDIVGWNTDEVLHLTCREVFARGKKPVQVDGPLLEDEAREVHLGFWS